MAQARWITILAVFLVLLGSYSHPNLAHGQEVAPCFSVEELANFGDIIRDVFEPPNSGILAGVQMKFKHSWTAPLGWVIDNGGRKVTSVKPGDVATVFNPERCRPMARTKSGGSTPAPIVAHEVTVVNFAFRPGTITIRSGQTVTWVNHSRLAHSVVSGGSWWGTIEPGHSLTVDISTPGWYPYVCGFHSQMSGTIQVIE